MKNGKRITMVSLLMLLMVFGSASLAQPMTMAFCGDLSEADCELITSAQAAMSELESGSADFTMDLNVTDIPDAPMDSIAFNITGDAAYAVDPALMEMMHSMQTDPTAMFADPEAMAQMFSDMFGGIAADVNLTVALPGELISMMAASDTSLPETLSVSMRIVDGFGYVNLDDIASAIPDAGMPEGWVGLDLAGLMDLAMQNADFSAAGAMMDPEMMNDYMSSFKDPEIFGQFLTIERGADAEVMGQPVAVFNSSFDYATFFQSDVFQNMMSAQMEMMGEMMGEGMSEDDMAEMDETMGMIGGVMENMTLEMTQTVGLDDNYIHTFEMHFAWDMTEFMMMVDPTSDAAAPNFTFDITVTNTGFNNSPEIVAPEDATIFPLEMMMPQANS